MQWAARKSGRLSTGRCAKRPGRRSSPCSAPPLLLPLLSPEPPEPAEQEQEEEEQEEEEKEEVMEQQGQRGKWETRLGGALC